MRQKQLKKEADENVPANWSMAEEKSGRESKNTSAFVVKAAVLLYARCVGYIISMPLHGRHTTQI